ncbi:MAG: pilus assembly protein PilM [Bacillaceae bacterium]|nr:pilus assembly protein PilM [Bacillaceae bacterium]
MVLSLLRKGKIANIELKDYVIRYAEIKSQNPLKIADIGEYYLPEGIVENGQIVDQDAFQRHMKICAKKWKLKGKSVRFIVPDSSVIIRKQMVPGEVEKDELVNHFYFELGHSIHLPFENPILEAVLLSETEDQKETLLIAAPEEIIFSYRDLFKGLGMKPIAADVSSLCHYRMFHSFDLTNDRDHFLVVQLNLHAVTVSIFEQHRPIFMQQFNVSYTDDSWIDRNEGEDITREHIKKESVMEAFEDIYMETERILRFYQFSMNNGQKEINTILAAGDHPYFKDIVDNFKMRFSMPVHFISSQVMEYHNEQGLDWKFHSVLGLAMKEGD